MADELSTYDADLLDGSYDCVDRIVLNAYHTLCYSPGGFRQWWRQLMNGQEDMLDNAHLMRMAGRFSRRVRAYAKAHGIPVIDCARGDRKHEIADEHLSTHPEVCGLSMILVARAQAPVWEVQRSTRGAIRNLAAKKPYVNHYSFHILDPEWGHLTIKMSGQPPFGAQIILNGHTGPIADLPGQVLVALDHLTQDEREGVFRAVRAFAHGEVDGSRVPGTEPLYALRAAPEVLVFVRHEQGGPVEPVAIMRPAALRTLGHAE